LSSPLADRCRDDDEAWVFEEEVDSGIEIGAFGWGCDAGRMCCTIRVLTIDIPISIIINAIGADFTDIGFALTTHTVHTGAAVSIHFTLLIIFNSSIPTGSSSAA
jgi:hypothetical protein